MVGRRRFKILRAWEVDGYRMAQPAYFGDEAPAANSPEGARLAQLAAAVEALADQWVDKVKCAAFCTGHHNLALLKTCPCCLCQWSLPLCCHIQALSHHPEGFTPAFGLGQGCLEDCQELTVMSSIVSATEGCCG